MYLLTSMRRVKVRQTTNARTRSQARPHCMPVTAWWAASLDWRPRMAQCASPAGGDLQAQGPRRGKASCSDNLINNNIKTLSSEASVLKERLLCSR